MDTLAAVVLVLALSGLVGVGLAYAAFALLFEAMKRHGQMVMVDAGPARGNIARGNAARGDAVAFHSVHRRA